MKKAKKVSVKGNQYGGRRIKLMVSDKHFAQILMGKVRMVAVVNDRVSTTWGVPEGAEVTHDKRMRFDVVRDYLYAVTKPRVNIVSPKHLEPILCDLIRVYRPTEVGGILFNVKVMRADKGSAVTNKKKSK